MDRKAKLKLTLPSVFLSYAQADREGAEALIRAYAIGRVSAWRDKTKSARRREVAESAWRSDSTDQCAGPTLVCSRLSFRVRGTRMEHRACPQKTVLPVLSDETPLPVALRATQGIKERELERIVERVVVALKALESAPPDSAPGQGAIMGGWMTLLSEIHARCCRA